MLCISPLCRAREASFLTWYTKCGLWILGSATVTFPWGQGEWVERRLEPRKSVAASNRSPKVVIGMGVAKTRLSRSPSANEGPPNTYLPR
jgi:hypothetical protein